MKKVIISSVLIALVLLMSSCGSKSIQGTWKVDPSSLDLVLGEGFPEEMKKGVEETKVEVKSEKAQKELDKITLELLEGGVAKLKHADHAEDTQEFHWKQNGDVLNLNGEIDGEKFNANLNILKSSADEVTIGLTGESLLEQVKAERPELMEQIPAMFDVKKLVEGAKVSISMKKA
jgi:hypothetical protein